MACPPKPLENENPIGKSPTTDTAASQRHSTEAWDHMRDLQNKATDTSNTRKPQGAQELNFETANPFESKRAKTDAGPESKSKPIADSKPDAKPDGDRKEAPEEKATKVDENAGKVTRDKDGNKIITFTNDKENRVSETEFYDNKHDGAKRETIYNGRKDELLKKTDFLNRKEMTYQSGAKVTEYEWGDKRNPDPDLVKVTESASGNYKRSEYERRSDKVDSITEYKDRKDGKVKYTSKEDGSDESVYQDGTIKQRDKSGKETIIKPPKEEIQPVTITDKDGNKVTTFTDDKEKRVSETRFYDHKHGAAREETIYKGREDHVAKKTDFLNRTEMTYENGSKTTEFDRGNRHNDPNLVRVSEKADGSYKRSDFVDRFDKVESITEYNNRKDGRVKYTSRQDGSGEFVYKDGTIKEHDKFGNDTIIKPPPREAPQTK